MTRHGDWIIWRKAASASSARPSRNSAQARATCQWGFPDPEKRAMTLSQQARASCQLPLRMAIPANPTKPMSSVGKSSLSRRKMLSASSRRSSWLSAISLFGLPVRSRSAVETGEHIRPIR
jgi:hypothetical protein